MDEVGAGLSRCHCQMGLPLYMRGSDKKKKLVSDSAQSSYLISLHKLDICLLFLSQRLHK